MSHIKFTARANQDLQRVTQFLRDIAPDKVGAALDAILGRLEILKNNPLAGEATPRDAIPDLRKLTIPYGKTG